MENKQSIFTCDINSDICSEVSTDKSCTSTLIFYFLKVYRIKYGF